MNNQNQKGIRDIPAVLWIGLPVLGLIYVLIAPVIAGYDLDRHYDLVRNEISFIEISTVVFCFAAAVFAILAFKYKKAMVKPIAVLLSWADALRCISAARKPAGDNTISGGRLRKVMKTGREKRIFTTVKG